jgi:predicted DNA-binding WGR domain protein
LIQNRGVDNDTLHSGLHLERHDRAKNLHRCYGLQLARSLFGHWGVVRQWGRVGRPGSTRTEWFACAAEAKAALRRKLAEKQRRGYALRATLGERDAP